MSIRFYKCSCCGILGRWIIDDIRGDIVALSPLPICDKCWETAQSEEVVNA